MDFSTKRSEDMILPINVKESDFKAAIAKFEAVLGKEWVFKSEEDLNSIEMHTILNGMMKMNQFHLWL